MQDKYLNSDYQRAVSEFVEKHVYQCASMLVYNLRADDFSYHTHEAEFDGICEQLDYTTPALWHVENELGNTASVDLFDALADEGFEPGTTEQRHPDAMRVRLSTLLEAGDIDAEDFCHAHDVEPEVIGAYEHWIISDNLRHWLEKHNEMVTDDFFGLNIWGRTTTGQSISLDRVICDIFDELNPDWKAPEAADVIRHDGGDVESYTVGVTEELVEYVKYVYVYTVPKSAVDARVNSDTTLEEAAQEAIWDQEWTAQEEVCSEVYETQSNAERVDSIA